eukprot:scaffold7808_cov184-Amphora_coffeaeformis.AAC.28
MTSIEQSDVKTETAYALAEPATVDGAMVRKPGHKCCGCDGCCDMRRAVIIVNIIQAGILGMGMLILLATRNLANNAGNIYDDDTTIAAMEDFKDAPLGVGLAIMGVQIVAALCGIAGGMKFNVILTAVAGLSYTITFAMGLVSLNLAGLVYNGFFLYPHILFVQEIRNGIMTEANYPNEKQSCCCV